MMEFDALDPLRRSNLPYPMELGSPAFFPVEIEKEKDIIHNAGKLHAKQEYDRIMEQVNVLKRQADELVNRMHVSELMHSCVYGIKVVHGKIYHVYRDDYKNHNTLSINSPGSWTAFPGHYTYIMSVRLMGDSTWEEVIYDGLHNNKKE
jgi:hypothetical protein